MWAKSRAAGFKPVAAGAVEAAGRWVNDDVEALRGAGSVERTADEVCPCLLRSPCAPHIAAGIDGIAISREGLCAAAREAMRGLDALVVEGVGGFCVPLGENWDSADLACDLALELEGLPLLREAIKYCESVNDYVSRKLFADILDSEEEHIDWIETQLSLIDRLGEQNYLLTKIED